MILLLNELYWELSTICRQISSIFHGLRKVQISKILKVLFFIQFECSFCKLFILKCYWMGHKNVLFHSKKFRNFAYLIVIRIFIIYPILMGFFNININFSLYDNIRPAYSYELKWPFNTHAWSLILEEKCLPTWSYQNFSWFCYKREQERSFDELR